MGGGQVAGSLGALHEYRVSARQELLALSATAAAGCLFGSLPPSASFSRSALLGTLGDTPEPRGLDSFRWPNYRM